MKLTIIIPGLVAGFAFLTVCFLLSTRVKKGNFSFTFPFHYEEFPDKELFGSTVSRAYRTISIYGLNCIFIICVAFHNNTVQWYTFALLFTSSTLVMWYVNIYRYLEISYKSQKKEESE